MDLFEVRARCQLNIVMRALWDRHPLLPYSAIVPWPLVVREDGLTDWTASVSSVETWLLNCVGPHYTHWTWAMWALHQGNLCSVRFAREPDSVLFLLRFS